MSSCLCCQDYIKKEDANFYIFDERLINFDLLICEDCETVLRGRKDNAEDYNVKALKEAVYNVRSYKSSIKNLMTRFADEILVQGVRSAGRIELEGKFYTKEIYKLDIYITKEIDKINKIYPDVVADLANIGLVSTASKYFKFSSTEVMELFKIKQSAITRLRKEMGIKGYGYRYDRSEINKMLKY